MKQARNKQVCIGKIDPKTGEFVPSKRLDPKQSAVRDPEVTACATVVGASVLLDHLCEQLGLEEILKAHEKPLTSQRISEVLSSLKEGEMQTFFDKWSKKVLEDDYLCYDITSIFFLIRNE